MSSTALKVAAVILVLLTIIVAGIAFSMSRNYAARTAKAESAAAHAAEAARTAPKTLAVVALKALAAYKTIARDDVALVPVAVTPAGYYGSLDEVTSRVPLVDIDAGAPVTKRYFKEGNILAKTIPPGHQALAIEVNEVIAAGGFVRPGDNVDVIVYFRSGAGVAAAQARVLLENVRVLAFEDRIIDRPQDLKDEDRKASNDAKRRIRTAVLAVPDQETTRLVLGVALGEVRLALRGQQTVNSEEASAELAEAGLPLTETAKANQAAHKTSDKAVTAEQISRLQLSPALAKKVASARQTVEVIQGNKIEKVEQ